MKILAMRGRRFCCFRDPGRKIETRRSRVSSRFNTSHTNYSAKGLLLRALMIVGWVGRKETISLRVQTWFCLMLPHRLIGWFANLAVQGWVSLVILRVRCLGCVSQGA